MAKDLSQIRDDIWDLNLEDPEHKHAIYQAFHSTTGLVWRTALEWLESEIIKQWPKDQQTPEVHTILEFITKAQM